MGSAYCGRGGCDSGRRIFAFRLRQGYSFDGGGPEYDFSIENPEIADFSTQREYSKPNHEELDGAGYDVVLTLTGKKAGETVLTASYSSPIGDSGAKKYRVTVADDLSVTAEQMTDE